jgi:hypothetical protein
LARPGPSSSPARAPLRPSRKSWEYPPYKDGHLQLELRRYVRRDGSACDRGPYWYFQFHEGVKRKKLYLGKTDNPKGEFERRCKAGSGGAGQL